MVRTRDPAYREQIEANDQSTPTVLFAGVHHFAAFYKDGSGVADADLKAYATTYAEAQRNGTTLPAPSKRRGRPRVAVKLAPGVDGALTTPGRRGDLRQAAVDRIGWFVPGWIGGDKRGTRRPGRVPEIDRQRIIDRMTEEIEGRGRRSVAASADMVAYQVGWSTSTVVKIWRAHKRQTRPPATVIVRKTIDGHAIDLHGTLKPNETIDGTTYRVFVPDEASKESALAWWSSRDQRRDQ